MTKELKSVSFVCMANYCRSPVAKMLFKNKFGDTFKIDSAGIQPKISAGMDARSVNFLKENNIPLEIHNPKKIDRNFFNSSNIIFAMDTTILIKLNNLFRKYRGKIKLFSYQHKNLTIQDPFNLSIEKYNDVMKEIKFVVDNFEIDHLI